MADYTIQQLKEMIYLYVWHHGWILKQLCRKKQKKNTSCMILLKHDARKCKPIYNKKKIRSCLVMLEVRAWGIDCKRAWENFQGWWVTHILIIEMVSQVYIYIYIYICIYVKTYQSFYKCKNFYKCKYVVYCLPFSSQ